MPFELVTDTTLVLPVSVNGAPTNAIVDSGSGATIISVGLARQLGLGIEERRRIRGLSARAEVRLAYDVELGVGHERGRLPFVVVTDLTLFSAGLGRPIDVLLGSDLLERYAVAIDFDHRRLALAPSGAFSGAGAWLPLPVEIGSYHELLTSIDIAGTSATLMIDLGSTASLMLSPAFVEEHGLTAGARTSTAVMGGVDGLRSVSLFPLSRAEIGPATVRSIPTVVPSAWLSESAAGNIGLPLLAQFAAVLDISARRLWLSAANHPLAMLKDRSGLGVAVSDDRLTVVHIARGSPAERAAWSVGDRILAVDGRPIDRSYTVGDLWRWRYGRQGRTIVLTDQDRQSRRLRLADYY